MASQNARFVVSLYRGIQIYAAHFYNSEEMRSEAAQSQCDSVWRRAAIILMRIIRIFIQCDNKKYYHLYWRRLLN